MRRHRGRSPRPLNRYAVIGLGIAALLGTAVAAIDLRFAPTSPLRSAPITGSILLDGRYSAEFAGEMVASTLGYLPLSVKVVPDPDDPEFVERVAREGIIGVTSAQKFLLGAWRGARVTAFAGSFLDTPVAIFTLESSGWRRPTDLIGKRVGYRRGSEGDVIFEAMMAQLGLPRSQITKVADRDSFEALSRHEVDAIISSINSQPSTSDLNFKPLIVIRPQDYGIHVPGLVYFASNRLISDYPSVISDVLRGIIRGWRFVYSDVTESITPILASDSSLNPERVKFELRAQRSLLLPIGSRIADYDDSRWRTLRDILLFAKLGKEEVPLVQVVTYDFLRDVYRRTPDQ